MVVTLVLAWLVLSLVSTVVLLLLLKSESRQDRTYRPLHRRRLDGATLQLAFRLYDITRYTDRVTAYNRKIHPPQNEDSFGRERFLGLR